MKFSLGTVQFGLNYGISNNVGVTPVEEVNSILDYAHNNGVRLVDTAPAYGNAEVLLGELLSKSNNNFQVITKFHDINRFWQCLDRSRLLLGKNLYGLLSHKSELITESDSIRNWLSEVRSRYGIKIGISVYNQAEIERVLKLMDVDIVQIPLNILDHRLIKSGILEELKNQNVEIHVRSVFLQGLFFLQEEKLKVDFPSVIPALGLLKQIAKENDLTLSDLALLFVNSIPEVDRFIIGINNLKQLKENLISLEKSYNYTITQSLLDEISFTEEKVLNPALWAK